MIKENLTDLIYEIRDKYVILVSDLAILYNCKNRTKEINQAVKRNKEKFLNENYFQLTKEEFSLLKSQIVTAKNRFSKTRVLQFAKIYY